jgi:hypothetical protein
LFEDRFFGEDLVIVLELDNVVVLLWGSYSPRPVGETGIEVMSSDRSKGRASVVAD